MKNILCKLFGHRFKVTNVYDICMPNSVTKVGYCKRCRDSITKTIPKALKRK